MINRVPRVGELATRWYNGGTLYRWNEFPFCVRRSLYFQVLVSCVTHGRCLARISR